MTTENTIKMSAAQESMIEKAIAAAKARKAAKEANGEAAESTDQAPVKVAPKAKPADKVKKEKVKKAAEVVKAEKVDRKAQRDAERAAAKALRDQERAEKKAAKEAAKAAKVVNEKPSQPKHMAKVLKAEALLPKMDENLASIFEEVKSRGLTEGQVTTLCAHLAHYNRVRATIRSADCKFEVGQTVEIISSDRDARLIGKRGVIEEVRKIRVLVDVGTTNPAYLFLSDIVAVEEENEEETEDCLEENNEEVSDAQVDESVPVTDESLEFLIPNESDDEVDSTGTDNV